MYKIALAVVLIAGASAHAQLAQAPYSYTQDFESSDPFVPWASNGTYTVNYKGITTDQASSGTHSFKLDITLNSASYVYFAIPQSVIYVPAISTLTFSGNILVYASTGTIKASFANDTNMSPAPHSALDAVSWITAPTSSWSNQTADFARLASGDATRIVAKYFGGATTSDVGIWNDAIALLIVGNPGSGVTVYVDSISLMGYAPSTAAYLADRTAAWSAYLGRSTTAVTAMANYVLNANLPPNTQYFADAKSSATTALTGIQSRGYPTPSEWTAINSASSTVTWLLATFGNNAPFVLEPFSPLQSSPRINLLPPVPVPTGNNISLKAARGEFAPASFIISALSQNVSSVTITSSDLISAGGGIIPLGNINLRVVKCWYQAANGDNIVPEGGKYLLPELLLKDDSLVSVDTVAQTNALRVLVAGVQQYVDITTSASIFPVNATFNDAANLQPFNVPAWTEKQIWITIHVPGNAAPGDYTGTMIVNSSGNAAAVMNFTVSVLPFNLAGPLLNYGLYYPGEIYTSDPGLPSNNSKTSAQLALELADMRDHGVLYPTTYQTNSHLGEFLDDMKAAGLPTDKVYLLAWGLATSTTTAVATQQAAASNYVGIAKAHGFGTVYVYGIDEAGYNTVVQEQPVWQAMHDVGAKVFVAAGTNNIYFAGNLLDEVNLQGSYITPAQVTAWHVNGTRIASYGNPQVGLENPEIYRRNYGLNLLLAGYDDVMDFAYQYPPLPTLPVANIWNDFQGINYRSEVFAYPTSNGLVGTIEWESFRAAVDDVRYLSTLIAKDHSRTQAQILSWMAGVLEADPDLYAARDTIIAQILATPSGPPPTRTTGLRVRLH